MPVVIVQAFTKGFSNKVTAVAKVSSAKLTHPSRYALIHAVLILNKKLKSTCSHAGGHYAKQETGSSHALMLAAIVLHRRLQFCCALVQALIVPDRKL